MTEETDLTNEQITQQRAERLNRVLAEEKKQSDAKRAREEQSAAATRGTNEAFFAKEAEERATAEANRPIVLEPVTDAATLKAQEQARYPRPKVNKPPEGFVDAAGLIPCKRKPSITLQPLPEKYRAGDPRRGMSEDLIIRMGMNPDPTKPALEK